jgi:Peptidase C39 family
MKRVTSLLWGSLSLSIVAGTVFVLRPAPSSPVALSKAPRVETTTRAVLAPGARAASPVPLAALAPTVKNKANPLPELVTDYDKGDYKAVVAKANALLVSTPKVKPTRTLVRTQHLAAFATARTRDLKKAREAFAKAHESAKLLKEKRATPKLGELPSPTLEEDAAYQQAVCTMGLGQSQQAQAELIQFMRDYPTSPLVHAAMRRIARLNGGDIPAEAEAVWKQAKATQRTARQAEERLASLCGPECLVELLKRRGERTDIEALARELGTTHEGTSLAALEKAARKHGFPEAEGVQVTMTGLKSQKLPLIAVLMPGHFVLVEKLEGDGSVTFWDANAEGIGKEGRRTVSATVWQTLCPTGVALRLHGAPIPQPEQENSKLVARR